MKYVTLCKGCKGGIKTVPQFREKWELRANYNLLVAYSAEPSPLVCVVRPRRIAEIANAIAPKSQSIPTTELSASASPVKDKTESNNQTTDTNQHKVLEYLANPAFFEIMISHLF